MWVPRRIIKHVGYKLYIRNNTEAAKPSSAKQKQVKFVCIGQFGSRAEIHSLLKRKYPALASKDYRIIGQRADCTPLWASIGTPNKTTK